MTDLYERTQKFEGTRLKPYLDCCGKPWRECVCVKKGNLTIGVGRNLDENGVSASEVALLYRNDIASRKTELNECIPWAAGALNDARYAVLVDLCFNMGPGRLLGFKNMLAALRAGDWQRAHDELLYADPSKDDWTTNRYWIDVGDGPGGRFDRAERNAKQLLTGEWN